MTHCSSVNDAPSERPIAGSDTATMLESSIISDETSDAVSNIQNLDASAALPWCVTLVMRGSSPPPWRRDSIAALPGDRISHSHAQSEHGACERHPSGR